MSFTIRELELLSGIRAHTIRIWEQRYNFIKPSRTQTNIRVYSNDELKTLLTVALLNKYGYKISRIDEMLPEQRMEAALELPYAEALQEGMINKLIGYMIDLDSVSFEEMLDKQIKEKGLEETITGTIFHFLDKVGILWQTNRILPVQEHIVSCIIRQKLVAAIESLAPVQRKEPLFLLFLPEGEHHEMGLLFVYYLLRKNNLPVLYLGANVPIKDLQYPVKLKQPAYIYLHLTSFPGQLSLQKFFSSLSQLSSPATVVVSGSVVQNFKKQLPAHFRLLSSFKDSVAYISSIK